MTAYTFNTVGRIVSGPGAARELEALCAPLGIRRPLLVTDPGLVAIGLVPPLQQALEAAGLEVTLFDQVREDPPESVVEAAAALAREHAADGVIAVGGGSSMDVAKV